MRLFLQRVLLFLLLLALPLMAGEVYLRQRPNPAKAKHAYLTQHSGAVEVLVLGSSHTYYGIAPEQLSPHAYSAAMVSQTYRYDHALLTHYAFPRLRTLILPFSDFSLYESLEGGDEWYLASRYRLYMNVAEHSRWSKYNWEITSFRTYLERLRSLWTPSQLRWSPYGQGLEYTLRNRPHDWDNGADRAQHNSYTHFSECAQAGEPYLWKMAEWARAHSVQLVLVATPLTPSYRAHQQPAQLADMQHRLHALLAAYPSTVTYLDYRSDARFTASDFYDADHLSLGGSHRFTQLLKREIGKIPMSRQK